MIEKHNQRVAVLVEGLRLFSSISFGVFLFILFFQPFALDKLDFNNRLLFVAGFGFIIFILSMIVLLSFISIFRVEYQFNDSRAGITYLMGIFVFILSAVAFTFYVRYVGLVPITFYIVFKVTLICISPLIAQRIYEVQKDLLFQNNQLIRDIKKLQSQIQKFEDDNLNKTIEFVSENSSENLILQLSEVVFVRSADNYVEVVYNEGNESYKKKLVRNTLKNIELQLNQYSSFIRCHRICIVNKFYIENLTKNYSNHWLTIRGYKEQIPVSRQYLLKVKEAI